MISPYFLLGFKKPGTTNELEKDKRRRHHEVTRRRGIIRIHYRSDLSYLSDCTFVIYIPNDN